MHSTNTEKIKKAIPHKMKKENISVSVVGINWNQSSYLKKWLKSFVRQKPEPLEIIIIDNNSTDNSLDIVNKYFPKLRVIKNKQNKGYAAACNQGIKLAKGEVVVLSNIDLYVEKGWIKEVLKEFKKIPKCAVVTSKILYMDDPKVINSTGFLIYKDFSPVGRSLDEKDIGQYEKHEEVFGAGGAIMAWRKKCFSDIDLFDEDFFLFHEEFEMMCRLRVKGWTVRYSPKAIVYHKRSASTGLYSPLKLYYSERNRIWVILEYLPFWYTHLTRICRYEI